ncbi:hypothetical protein STSP2_02477 [Anaerohalosphaera lusitana]|uniref:Uncharacterized protein n=1 Tax=Anaerohalosphaera lusitana TaxID=1936003 RepID=A0A1U9NNI1_9BACT|nr:hypothetical protein [Anaerohalosphaera lusitana]AQT69288.1 hypothetical protein STSP2_02477 [Anaerohalosphaera lusitana]
MKNNDILLVVTIILAIVFLSWFFIREHAEIDARIGNTMKGLTRERLASFEFNAGLRWNQKCPPETLVQMVSCFKEEYDGQEGLGYGLGIDIEKMRVLDYWKQPVRLKIISRYCYQLVSPGPNQTYENGTGDDIVHSFNPYEWDSLKLNCGTSQQN